MIPTFTFKPASSYRPGPHWVALLATVFTWPLLFVGGLVTTYRVGMAVPDWPTTFGINMFLYDMSNAAWGVFIEHGHRLYGAAVGLFVILLTLDFLCFSRSRMLKGMAVVALVAVIAQGVLGGIRVRQNSTLLASIHGCTGLLFFAYMVLLCVLTGRGIHAAPTRFARAGQHQFWALSTLAVAYLQVILGAWLRHFPNPTALLLHAVVASVVAALVLSLVFMTEKQRAVLQALLPASRALAAALVGQVLLGVAAWWMLRPFDGIPRDVSSAQALIRTGHQANSALLLAALVVYAVRSCYQLVPLSTGREGQTPTTARVVSEQEVLV